MDTQYPEVTFNRRGNVGRISLDRPKALNALTIGMIEELHRILDAWERDPGAVLVLDSSSPRAFCAGGDIRQIRQHSVDGRHDDGVAFFAAEYALNNRLAELSTPQVSLIDGICMGGGLGLSVHGTFRVLSDKASMAMPETAIGFFPDVGASHFLSRLPGALGPYLGLTGYRMDAADALYTGLGTHLVTDVDAVLPALEQHDGAVDEVLRSMSTAPAPSHLAAHRSDIDWCFGAPSVDQIRNRLHDNGSNWATDTLEVLDAMSPQSLDVTLALLIAGKEQPLRQCLDMELAVTGSIITTHDFIEGVRAALVDKDKSPAWAAPGTTQIRIPSLGFTVTDPRLTPARPHIGVST